MPVTPSQTLTTTVPRTARRTYTPVRTLTRHVPTVLIKSKKVAL
jgi:hypothetical protein